MKILSIIPARGGSKGIPLKNIVDIGGKPLIQYTIDMSLSLLQNSLIDELVVSTDSEEIAYIAENLGVGIPFLRPSNISDDKAKSIDYIFHTLNFFEQNNKTFDTVILLQPTSPLRTYEDLTNSITLFKENNSDSLISVYKEETINELIMYHREGDFAVALDKNHNKGVRRQDHGWVYIRNGAIYITKVNYLRKEGKIISDKPLLYEMSKSRSINIDSYNELELVRNMLCKFEF